MQMNPFGKWFRPKVIGLGWTPASWEGWLVTAALAALILTATFSIRL